jgi:16S rRNA (guanine1207-N2)-methyltransferase
LLQAVQVAGASSILDLGCGYGVVGIVLARRAPTARVALVDVNPRAVALAVENIVLNDVPNAEALCGDGCAPVAGRTFDVIAMNPPIRAGRAVVLRLIEEGRACMSPSGRLYLVARTSQGAQTLGRLMGERFARVTEVERGGGFRVYEARHV